MNKPMELDDALAILTEIATGDKEREAMCLVKESIYGLEQEADTYRHLYESIQKKLTLYRGLAAMPDIHKNSIHQEDETKKDGE